MKENDISNIMFSLMKINDYSVVFVSGRGSKSFLQNQVTINIDLLMSYHHVLCAHCNVSGKVLSVLRLFCYQDGYIYLQKKDVSDIQIKEFKKYTVFSDVNIFKLHDYVVFGIAGLNARDVLSLYFSYLPNMCKSIVIIQGVILLWFQDPEERFLLIAQKKDFINIKKNILNNFFIIKDNIWNTLDMVSGIPIFTKEVIGKFLPQEINLEFLNGIDYQKGCYLGQEIISRVYFRKMKIKRLYNLIGTSKLFPNIFSIVEMYDGILWKKVGIVFFSLCLTDNNFLIQVLLRNQINKKNIFRISVDLSSRFQLYKNIFIKDS